MPRERREGGVRGGEGGQMGEGGEGGERCTPSKIKHFVPL